MPKQEVPSPGDSLSSTSGDPTSETTAAEEMAEAVEQHAAAEGAEGAAESTSTLRDMLLSTGPEESLESIESPWQPERGGPRRIYRGVRKMGEIEGMPAIVDVLIGLAETVVVVQEEMGGDGDDVEADGDEQDGDGVDDDLAALAGAGV